MKVIEPQAARFDNTKIYIHRRSKKEGGAVDGRYIRVGGIFKLGAPDLKHRQFMGIHEHLFVTMSYPDYVTDLFGAAADLPGGPGIGFITWICKTSCSVGKGGLWYFIPRSIWDFAKGDFAKTIRTSSMVSIVAGEGSGYYHLLNFPLLTREYLRSRYRTGKKVK